eukprot:jgi/Ulvmu1/12479/UM009_0132.1
MRLKRLRLLWAAVAAVVLYLYLGSSSRSRCKSEAECDDAKDGSRNDHRSLSDVAGVHLSEAEYLAAKSQITTHIMQQQDTHGHRQGHGEATTNLHHADVMQTGDDSIRCKMSSICDAPPDKCYPGLDGLGCVADVNERREHAVSAIKWAWKAYRRCAWGDDELRPISCRGHQWFGLGLSMIDSLDTLILAGLAKDVQEVVHWIDEMNPAGAPNVTSNTFECTIRVVGGLLSAAHMLDGDKRLLKPAIEIALRLLVAFNTESGIPYSDVDLQTVTSRQPSWTAFSSLSEATTLSLEFCHVAKVAAYEAIALPALHVWDVMRKISGTVHGLAPAFLDPDGGKSGRFGSTQITLGARGDSYYEYMLKQYIIGGRKDKHLLGMYQKAMQGVRSVLLGQSGRLDMGGLFFIGEWNSHSQGKLSGKMDHLVCFLPGLLALGHFYGIETGTQAHHMSDLDLARQLMRTCYSMYKFTPTGLAPELVHFNTEEEGSSTIHRWSRQHDAHMEPKIPDEVGGGQFRIKHADSHNLLRPETVESLFILWRVTGDQRYQDWGWQIFRAFEMHARFDRGGYTNLDSVLSIPAPRRDKAESFFIAETLKYLLLLFSPGEVLPLRDFVFNTEAHPLPILNSPVERAHSLWYLDPPDGLNQTISLDSHSLQELIIQFRNTWQ